MHADGGTLYGIAKQLTPEGIRTRYGKEFKANTIQNILRRVVNSAPTQVDSLAKGTRRLKRGASLRRGLAATVFVNSQKPGVVS